MGIRDDMPESLSDLFLFYGAVGIGVLIGLYVYAVCLT
jgi:hypothetical protein